MSNWLVDKLIPSIMRSEVKKSSVPEGLWHKCPSCEAVLYRPELEKTLDVCPKCDHHMRIGARARFLAQLHDVAFGRVGLEDGVVDVSIEFHALSLNCLEFSVCLFRTVRRLRAAPVSIWRRRSAPEA